MQDQTQSYYQPPRSALEHVAARDVTSPYEGVALATVGQRFAAYVVDTLAFFAVCAAFVGVVAAGSAISENEDAVVFGCTLLGTCVFIAFAAVQLKLLLSYGQSVGKRALGIKIVDDQDGRSHPHWASLLFLRTLLPGVLNYGCGLFVIIDSLMILRLERRCLHDVLARTHVVQIGDA